MRVVGLALSVVGTIVLALVGMPEIGSADARRPGLSGRPLQDPAAIARPAEPVGQRVAEPLVVPRAGSPEWSFPDAEEWEAVLGSRPRVAAHRRPPRERPPVLLEVCVLGPARRPVEGARVVARPVRVARQVEPLPWAETDGEGRAVLRVPAGTYRVSALHPSLGGTRARPWQPPGSQISLTLTPWAEATAWDLVAGGPLP